MNALSSTRWQDECGFAARYTLRRAKSLMLIGDSLPEKSGLFPDRQTTANFLFSRINARPQNQDLFRFSEDFSKLPAGNLGEA